MPKPNFEQSKYPIELCPRCGGVQYDLGQVRAPVDVFWAPKDWAAGKRDIDDIVKQGGWQFSSVLNLNLVR